MLERLFQLQPENMESLLEDFLEGRPFKTVSAGDMLGG